MNGQFWLQVAELGISEIVPIEGLILRLKNIFTLNPDAKVSVTNLTAEALQADADTIALAAKFYTDHNLPLPAELQAIVNSQTPPPAQQ